MRHYNTSSFQDEVEKTHMNCDKLETINFKNQ